MPGGEIQIAAQGAHDIYLTGDPQMSFFKAVYKRYTYFSMQLIQLDDDNASNTLNSYANEMTLKYKVPRNGDLLREIYIQFELPNVYSDSLSQFQWIRRIGEYIVNEVRLIGGNNIVFNRISPEYMHIHAELTRLDGRKLEYYREIGHVPQLYDPANAGLNNGIYPARSLPPNGADNGVPSIPAWTVTLAVPFWFCNNSGTALPLIAMQRMDLRIEVDLKPLNYCYTVIDTNPSSPTFQSRVRPTTANQFLSNFCPASPNNDNALPNNKVEVYGNYVFLDREERKRFAQTEQSYLMRKMQYYRDETGNVSTGGNFNADLRDINLPVAQLFFMARRQDAEDTNQWSNFTLWDPDQLSPILNPGYVSEYNNNYVIPPGVAVNQSIIRQPDPIRTVELILNAVSRFDRTDIEFFKVNRMAYNPAGGSATELNGVYTYSFAVDNEKYQPSGTCNFSMYGKKELRLGFKDVQTNAHRASTGQPYAQNYRVILIAESVNIFRVIAGLVGEEFSN
jgi:hypothetical protein